MNSSTDLSLQMECTLFFQENPYTFETMEGIALRLGRSRKDIQPVIEHLTALSILEAIGEGEHAIFRYIQPDIRLTGSLE